MIRCITWRPKAVRQSASKRAYPCRLNNLTGSGRAFYNSGTVLVQGISSNGQISGLLKWYLEVIE